MFEFFQADADAMFKAHFQRDMVDAQSLPSAQEQVDALLALRRYILDAYRVGREERNELIRAINRFGVEQPLAVKGEARLRKLFNYCGRPDPELEAVRKRQSELRKAYLSSERLQVAMVACSHINLEALLALDKKVDLRDLMAAMTAEDRESYGLTPAAFAVTIALKLG